MPVTLPSTMKSLAQRLALPALCMLTFATAAHAGTFSTAAWTNDASTGISTAQTTWSDARQAIRRFADKVGDAYRANAGS